MTNGSDKDYAQQGRVFLNQAFEELSRDDLRQASEKGWGAAAQMVKAYAQERGLAHDRHARLYGVVSRLVQETDDDDLRRQFSVAGTLHENFYEGEFGVRDVRGSLEDVSHFVDKVETLLNGRNGA